MSVWRSTCVLWPMASAPTLLVGTSVPVQLAIPETEFGVTRRMSAEWMTIVKATTSFVFVKERLCVVDL